MNRSPRFEEDIKDVMNDYESQGENIFLTDLKKETNFTYTENGALTHKSSKSDLLNFYMQGGAMRNRTEDEIIQLFNRAKAEDSLRALKCVFYFGDIREGQGERRLFKTLLKYIANNYPKFLEENINLIPFYNRWDSICVLFDTPLEKKALEIIKLQLEEDLKAEKPSLMAKWLPSPNTNSKETRKLGNKVAKSLKLAGEDQSVIANVMAYRKVLKELRAKINVVESKMCAKEFHKINYEAVPSVAANKYANAFYKNDENRYGMYINDLAEDKVKVNASVLFPYKIVGEFLDSGYDINLYKKVLLEKQWENLPNYINNADVSGIVVADVSMSMNGDPMNVAISLAMYMAERISGLYKNKFITFSEEPELVEIVGDSFHEKVLNIKKANWDMNTNIEKVFDLILNIAIKNNLSQSEIPKYLYIVSDMEFDQAETTMSHRETDSVKTEKKNALFGTISEKFKEKGYELPRLVFWNVDARNDQSPMTVDDNGWMGVSGLSQNIFKALMNNEFIEIIERSEEEKKVKGQKSDAEELMRFVLDSERYAIIKI